MRRSLLLTGSDRELIAAERKFDVQSNHSRRKSKPMTNKKLVRAVGPTAKLFRDKKTGVAWVEDVQGNVTVTHAAHPRIEEPGRVSLMVKNGMWKKTDRVVKCGPAAYNIDVRACTTPLDYLAANACACGANHPPRATIEKALAQLDKKGGM
jgi:hypothetical protein